jgi:hypothetical protein
MTGNVLSPLLVSHGFAVFAGLSFEAILRSVTGPGLFLFIMGWPLLVAPFAATWALLSTAGRPGWISLVPIYNWIELLRIAGLPAWWLVLLLVPGPNVALWVICCLRFARAFGQTRAFAMGLAFLPPVYIAILAWKSPEYRDPRLLDRDGRLPDSRFALRPMH